MLTDPVFMLQANGDAAVDICFAEAPSEHLSERIIALAEAIASSPLREGITDLVPAYQCLTVCFDPLRLPTGDSGTPDMAGFEKVLTSLTKETLTTGRAVQGNRQLIRIPVCYDDDFAPDLRFLSEKTGLSTEEIIARHSAARYLVHMLGFTPGFLYLGGLDRKLHCARKARPELQVPAGSVGIGGTQTGIYPQATPGGWQIIGRTPLALFRPQQEPAFIARPLDRIQFVPISATQFADFDPFAAPDCTPLDDLEKPEALR